MTGHHHRAPRSRRDLLAQGLKGFAVTATVPSLSGLFYRQAMAQSSQAALPLMVFDMAGGSGLPGSFLVGKAGGPMDLLNSYDLLGWDPRENGVLDEQLGLPMAIGYSTLRQGIMDNTSPEARQRLRLGSICHFGQDDTPNNPLNIASLAVSAGSRGRFVKNGLSIRNSVSGGRSRSTQEIPELRPVFVESIEDVLGATSVGETSYPAATPEQLRLLASQGVTLQSLQSAAMGTANNGAMVAELADEAYRKALEFIDGATGLDPRIDNVVAGIYGLNQGSSPTSREALSAALAMNTVRGYSGPGVWTLGGCDYHDSTQTTGDARDLDIGIEIGRAIETAHQLQQPLFFQLITDGGVGARRGSRIWTSEAGDKSMTVIGFYHPEGAPNYYTPSGSNQPRIQVGAYTDGQSADRTTLVGSEPLLAAYGAFANYLNCMGRLSEFGRYAPGVFSTAAELESVLIFDGSVG